MRMAGSTIELSASDLSGFLSCIHLTTKRQTDGISVVGLISI
jgi:hypothetical protein